MAAQSVSWFPPEVAWTLPGKSLDTRACSDSQTVTAVGWWHHLSRACSLLAWVAKQRMLSCGFFSFFLVSRTLLICQTLRPGKFLSTQNASLCRWNLVLSGPCWHTSSTDLLQRDFEEETTREPFDAGSYSFPPAVRAGLEMQHSLTVTSFSLLLISAERRDPLCARDLDGRHVDFLHL